MIRRWGDLGEQRREADTIVRVWTRYRAGARAEGGKEGNAFGETGGGRSKGASTWAMRLGLHVMNQMADDRCHWAEGPMDYC